MEVNKQVLDKKPVIPALSRNPLSLSKAFVTTGIPKGVTAGRLRLRQ